MQGGKMPDLFLIVIWIEKERKNVLRIVVLHLYYFMLESIDYFATVVVTESYQDIISF